MAQLGSEQRPLAVAIVGSGPAGFYAAEALLKSELAVKVSLFERLPAPYGLVRSGVAPDHPKLKQAIKVYARIAESDDFHFLGNVTIGRDVLVEELQATHHAVVFACGAQTDRRLGIPGEDLPGSHTATEFVGWYNGHPDYRARRFDLSCETAVIIGQGNVAADVSRILAKSVDELRHTDIAQHALEVLAASKIRDIYVIGRRGPAQAKFTSKELKEFGELQDCAPVVDAEELALNPESEAELADKRSAGNKKVYELFVAYSKRAASGKARRCHFSFLKSPTALLGRERVARIVLEKNRLAGAAFSQAAHGSGESIELETGLVFRSIGYQGVPIAGVPFDAGRGVFPTVDGRITDEGAVIPGLYAAGWIKRGPTGIIGTNRADSRATIAALLQDLAALDGGADKGGTAAVCQLLQQRGVRYVGFPDWKRIDQSEIERGRPKAKPREKYTSTREMLAVLDA